MPPACTVSLLQISLCLCLCLRFVWSAAADSTQQLGRILTSSTLHCLVLPCPGLRILPGPLAALKAPPRQTTRTTPLPAATAHGTLDLGATKLLEMRVAALVRARATPTSLARAWECPRNNTTLLATASRRARIMEARHGSRSSKAREAMPQSMAGKARPQAPSRRTHRHTHHMWVTGTTT